MSDALLISEARQLFPKNFGRLVHIHTIRRWIAKGLKVNGRVVVLKAERVGLRYMTRPEWVAEFIKDCSDRMEPGTFTGRSDASAADRFLESEGMYVRSEKKQVLGPRV
jgi:hypothetical protein